MLRRACAEGAALLEEAEEPAALAEEAVEQLMKKFETGPRRRYCGDYEESEDQKI